MICAAFIAFWSHLFCGDWSEPGAVFGWLKAALFNRLPEWLFKPIIGCPMCHAVWSGLALQVVVYDGDPVLSGLIVLVGSWGAGILEDFKKIREKWIHR